MIAMMHGLMSAASAPSYVVSNLALTTDLTDSKGRTWTPYGNAAVSSGALRLDGSGDYLATPNHADFDFGAGDFCIEGFLTMTATPAGEACILGKWAPSAYCWFFGVNGSRQLVFYWTTSGGNTTYPAGSALVPLSSEVHVTAYKKGGQGYLAVAGSPQAISLGDSILTGSTHITMGAQGNDVSFLTGALRHVRTQKGFSPYGSASFTPPTPPLSD